MAKPKKQREADKARKFFRGLSRREKNQLGDELVRGTFTWSEWMRSKPSAAFLRALDEERIDWEIREENPRKSLGSKMPEMSDADWVRLDVSQDLDRAASRLGGTGGRVEVTERTQESVRNAVDSALAKLKKARVDGDDLRERGQRLKKLADLPNSALNLLHEMSRAKGKKLRVTKGRVIDATVLFQRGYAKFVTTPRGTRFIKVAWADNPNGSSISGADRESNPGNATDLARRLKF